jgi:hypothetical protein
MLGHGDAGPSHNERGRRGDVERAHPAAAGATGVHQPVDVVDLEPDHRAPKGTRRAGYLLGGFTLRAEPHQERGGLHRRRLAPHHYGERLGRRLAREGSAQGQLVKGMAERSVLGHGRRGRGLVGMAREVSKRVFVKGRFCQL